MPRESGEPVREARAWRGRSCDIGVFFAVLMVGFAYVWRRGDLDWVRAVSRERRVGGRRSSGRRVELEVDRRAQPDARVDSLGVVNACGDVS